ncbi:MAG TPA: PAS domain S-box protein [Chloroflexia bacterium]|nr:PAS domain S-box protein [Chloroflexia bacterium]
MENLYHLRSLLRQREQEVQQLKLQLNQLRATEKRYQENFALLEKKERRFQTLLEHSTSILLILNETLICRYSSPAVTRLLGYSLHEVAGKTFQTFIHPDDVASFQEAYQIAIQQPGQAQKLGEWRLRHRSGTYCYFEFTVNNLLVEPALGGIVINLHEIDERKQLQENLRITESKLLALYNAGVVGILTGEEATVLDANDIFLEMLGYSRDEMYTRNLNLAALTPPEWQALDRQKWDELEATGKFGPFEKELYRKDGKRVAVLVGGYKLDNNPLRYISYALDISAIKEMQGRLSESEKRLSTLVSKAPVILFAINSNREFTLIAGERLALFGLKNEPVLGQSVDDIYRDYPDICHDISRALNGETFNEVRTVAGRVFEISYVPRHDRQAKVTSLIAVATEITDLIETQQALLEQVKKAAVAEERGRIARYLHDSLQQDFYGIQLNINSALVLLKRNPEKVSERLKEALVQAEGGKTELRSLIFDMRPEALERQGLVAGLGNYITTLRTRHHLQVESDLAEEPAISAEAKEALYWIARETLQNIIKHARATLVQIRLKVEVQPAMVILEIKDNGKGFEAQNFFPGHYGLTFMRDRAREAGLELGIESAPDRGTLVRACYNYISPDS